LRKRYSLDVIEEQDLEEEDPKETKESCTTFDGELPWEPAIEEFLLFLSSYSLCVQETNQHRI